MKLFPVKTKHGIVHVNIDFIASIGSYTAWADDGVTIACSDIALITLINGRDIYSIDTTGYICTELSRRNGFI